jgi:hypothetical protein
MKVKKNERLLNRDTRRGTQRKRERANTHTNTPGPERANPERAREKKSGGRRTRNKTSEGGEDGSASTNLGPNLPGEGRTHEMRTESGTS